MKQYIDWGKARLQSFRHAFRGLGHVLRTQPNAQIHVVIATAAIGFGFYVRLTATEWCLVALAAALVLGAEALNTAVEVLTDLVSPDCHPLAGLAKDTAAGGVMACALGAAAVGLIVFLPYLYALVFNG